MGYYSENKRKVLEKYLIFKSELCLYLIIFY